MAQVSFMLWYGRFIKFAERQGGLIFLIIFSLAFAVRFTILTGVPPEVMRWSNEASGIAHAIVTKHTFADPYRIATGPTAHSNPFYPALLALIVWIFGEGYPGAVVRCVVLISAYSALYALFPMLAEWFGMSREAGVIAGILAALLPTKRSAEIFRGWEDPFAALALAGMMLLVLATSRRRRPSRGFLIGAAVGGAIYISASLAPLAAALALLEVVTHPSRETIKCWALAVVIASLAISPWIIRNRLVLGHWFFMRDNFGLELHYSNHEGAAPSSELLNLRGASFMLHPTHSTAEAEVVRKLGEVAYNQRAKEQAVKWILQCPTAFATLTAQRVVYFWFGPPQHLFELAVTSAYTLLGFLGLPLLRRRCGDTVFRMWCVVLLVYPLIYYILEYVNRYRTPVDWLLWLPAGLVISRAVRHPARLGGTPLRFPTSSTVL